MSSAECLPVSDVELTTARTQLASFSEHHACHTIVAILQVAGSASQHAAAACACGAVRPAAAARHQGGAGGRLGMAAHTPDGRLQWLSSLVAELLYMHVLFKVCPSMLAMLIRASPFSPSTHPSIQSYGTDES
jgi:hypothetical protein